MDAGEPDVSGETLPDTVGPDHAEEEDEEDTTFGAADAPAWEDSDDERVTVSLANTNRLRKLRYREGEDVVSGKEYIKRLRRQYDRLTPSTDTFCKRSNTGTSFEQLNPVPEWVRYATEHRPSKRRRRDSGSGAGAWSDADDRPVEGMDLEDDHLAAQPLAKLLRNPYSLIPAGTGGDGRRTRLRPGLISIERTRDIAGVQPVSPKPWLCKLLLLLLPSFTNLLKTDIL